MAQIDGAGQQDTDNQNTEALQAALAQRQVTLQDQPQGGSDVPSHENSDPVSDESEILGSVSLLPENVVYRVYRGPTKKIELKPLSVSPFWPGLEQNGECSPLPALSPAPLPAASGASQPPPEQRQAALGPHPARR